MFKQDVWLYAVIAGLGAAQTYVTSGDLPAVLSPYFGIGLVMLVAVKAKRSAGRSEKATKPKVEDGELT